MTIAHSNAHSTSNRRALGLSNARRRPTNTLIFGAGLVLMALGAFAAGRNGDSGTATGTALASASPSTTTPSSVSSLEVLSAAPSAIAIPEGHDGVALTLPFTAAGGAYVGSGDRINIFAIGGDDRAGTSLLLPRIGVLDVSTDVAPRVISQAGERPSSPSVTFLLSVPSEQVDELVTAAATRTLYISLVASSDEQQADK